MPVIPAFGKLMQENHKFKPSPDYIESSCPNKQNNNMPVL
jgi:hypothetical protein